MTNPLDSLAAKFEPPKFGLGRIVATPGAIAAMEAVKIGPGMLLTPHVLGDWSQMDAEDQDANRMAVRNGYRVLSAYTVNGTKFWVITEADRSVTTILLPEEY